MIPWHELPKIVLDKIEFIGEFAPTVNPKEELLKGRMLDSDGDVRKVYLSAEDLQEIGNACLTVSKWLKERSEYDSAHPEED
jgi:hypothetical protein